MPPTADARDTQAALRALLTTAIDEVGILPDRIADRALFPRRTLRAFLDGRTALRGDEPCRLLYALNKIVDALELPPGASIN